MAITILQQPTSPNVSNTNLIYTISSSNVPQFQYRYIADLYYSGSATKLARFQYPQNSSGTANIDLGRPIGDYLDYDYNWKTDTPDSSSNNSKRFTVKFGEEYGTSYDSAVTTFADIAEANISVLKGSIQYPSVGFFDTGSGAITLQSSSINFNHDSYGNESYDPNPVLLFYADRTLSNNPNMLNSPISSKYNPQENITYTKLGWREDVYVSASQGYWAAQPIGTNDYATETYLNCFLPLGTYANRMNIDVYDDNNTKIVDTFVTGSALALSGSAETLTYPVGIKNLSNNVLSAISSSAQWAWYEVRFNTQNVSFANVPHFYYNEDKGPDALLSYTDASDEVRPGLFKNRFYPTYCNNEKTRFAFINSFGAWDYYNVYMPTRRVTNIDRKTYEQERINLNDRIATYNVSNRGELQYYTEYTDQFEITTDIIDSQESQWLREMFESTEVYIQSGSNFIPINITNTQEQVINNASRNPNFRYTIRYQFSNLREPR